MPNETKDIMPAVTQLPTPESKLMDQLVSGALGPLSHLRETIDLTLDEVSEWITQPQNRNQIANLVTLLDAQTQLIICQHRLIAVSRLADVATSSTSPETVRRACSDLLKIRLIDPYKEDKRPEKLPPPPVYSEEAILATLESLGKETLSSDSHSKETIIEENENLTQQNQEKDTFARANYTPSDTFARANGAVANEKPKSSNTQQRYY